MAQLTSTLEGQAAGLSALLESSEEPVTDIVLVNGTFVSSLYLPSLLARQWSPGSWSILSLAPHDHRLTRADARTLILETLDGAMLNTLPERIVLRSNEELFVGDRFQTGTFTAEILEADDRGPTRVAYEFDRNLDDPGLALVARSGGSWQRLSALALGEDLVLPAPETLAVP
jgi:hypothetical protein